MYFGDAFCAFEKLLLLLSNSYVYICKRSYGMKAMKYLYSTLFASCFFLPMQGQNVNTDFQREMYLEKEYNPSLHDANKINQLPEIREPEAPKMRVEFSDYTFDYRIAPYISKLDSKTYYSGFKTSRQRGYLNFSLSSLLNIDGDAGYQILNSEENRLNIFGSHRSGSTKMAYLQDDNCILENSNMQINDNAIGFDYVHHSKNLKLFADANYVYSAFNYYGYPITNSGAKLPLPPETYILTALDQNQSNNLFLVHAGTESMNVNEINFKANLTYSFFRQSQGEEEGRGRDERRIMGDFDLHTKFIGLAGYIRNYTYGLSNRLQSLSTGSWKNDTDGRAYGNYNYSVFSVNPYFTFEGDDWNVRLGGSAHLQFGGIKKLVLAPDIQFNWRPMDEILFYLWVVGGIKDNSNYNTYYENRYVSPDYRVYDSKSPVDATVGFNFSILPNLGIDVFAGYKWVRDEHFYVGNAVAEDNYSIKPRTIPLYMNAETFKLGGILKYTWPDIFETRLKLTYNQWKIHEWSNLVDPGETNYGLGAWNKPSFTGDLNIGFKVSNLPLWADIGYHLEIGRKTLYYNTVTNMKNIHAMNVQGTYTFDENFSAFARINNFLFQKYDLWYGYPAQNFNIAGGINIKF
jgi:hypothetical protein